ncbi:MAG: hypothetical protein EBY45_06155 [Gammaproteobacteria bacterium]|nr:hypothetical protein [Gammaproteobacteria bacterium]
MGLLGRLVFDGFPGWADIASRSIAYATRGRFPLSRERVGKVTLTLKTVNSVFFLSVSFSVAWY